MRWEDRRFIEDCEDLDWRCAQNLEREFVCPTSDVFWWEENQYWLPRLDVRNALELVTCLTQHHFNCCFTNKFKLNLQDGFLKDQHKPATTGSRDLKYNLQDGSFELRTKSYAMIKCDMDFGLYPFDTQSCILVIYPQKNLTYQGKSKSF